MMTASLRTLLAIVTIVAAAGGLVGVRAQTPPSQIVAAADSFLSALDESQQQRVLYDNDQRARWSRFPTGVVPRGGLD